jgi:hypothetical protein
LVRGKKFKNRNEIIFRQRTTTQTSPSRCCLFSPKYESVPSKQLQKNKIQKKQKKTRKKTKTTFIERRVSFGTNFQRFQIQIFAFFDTVCSAEKNLKTNFRLFIANENEPSSAD